MNNPRALEKKAAAESSDFLPAAAFCECEVFFFL